jgi:hypothetical protein
MGLGSGASHLALLAPPLLAPPCFGWLRFARCLDLVPHSSHVVAQPRSAPQGWTLCVATVLSLAVIACSRGSASEEVDEGEEGEERSKREREQRYGALPTSRDNVLFLQPLQLRSKTLRNRCIRAAAYGALIASQHSQFKMVCKRGA